MEQKQLMREVRRAALERMEDAARTESDFCDVLAQWNKLDENRERRERYHEVALAEWRGIFLCDFLDVIFDNPQEIWQLVEDWDIAKLIKALTEKQKEVLYFSAVKLCTPQQIASYQNKTDRAVRKLLAVALEQIRADLAPIIYHQTTEMTFAKRRFLTWYLHENEDCINEKSL